MRVANSVRHLGRQVCCLPAVAIRGSKIRGRRKENEVVSFKKLTFLKTELDLCFLLFSLLEPLMQCNLDANFLGRL